MLIVIGKIYRLHIKWTGFDLLASVVLHHVFQLHCMCVGVGATRGGPNTRLGMSHILGGQLFG